MSCERWWGSALARYLVRAETTRWVARAWYMYVTMVMESLQCCIHGECGVWMVHAKIHFHKF